MPALHNNLPAAERIALAVDTPDLERAQELVELAQFAGARVVKLGLELSSATSWATCSELAGNRSLQWVADAKVDDIPNTTAGIVRNLAGLDHPPVGITIHTNSGLDALKAAQGIAGDEGITMFGVTHLTSIEDDETVHMYGFPRITLVKRRLEQAAEAGLGGFVCSPRELESVVKGNPEFEAMFGMIPGARSAGADSHDQKNTKTPQVAIENGAGLLVVGRQVTQAADAAEAFAQVEQEIQQGLDKKEAA